MFQRYRESACNIQHIPLDANSQYDNVATPVLRTVNAKLSLCSRYHPIQRGMETTASTRVGVVRPYSPSVLALTEAIWKN